MSARPLLTLCMMVKDEAHGIACTLRSAKPWVDRWCILDTGSTDGTVRVVTDEMAGMRGHLASVTFDDFATTRNDLLERARGLEAEFLLLLDADDVLEGGEALRGFLECQAGWTRAHDREAFYLRMSEGACEWSSARVVRASAVGSDGWHYVCPVHEVLVHPSGRVPTITIPGVHIRHERPPQSAEKLRARMQRDVTLLGAEIERDPTNARATFYLAQTYKRLGERAWARTWFHRRVELGGWREEVFESILEAARLEEVPAHKVEGLLRAHAFAPHRAEPLVDLADHFRAKDEHGPAFTFAKRAAELLYPDGDTLFVDRAVYEWRANAVLGIVAYYLGEYTTGEQATWRAKSWCPESETKWRAQIDRNLRFYEERRAAR